MKRNARLLTLLTLFVIMSFLLSTTVLAQPTPAANPAVRGATVTKTISPAQQAAALKNSTRESLAAEKPLMMVDYGSPDAAASVEDEALAGAPGFAAAGAAAPGALTIVKQAYAQDWAMARQAATSAMEDEALMGPEGTSQVFTSYIVNSSAALQTMYPHRFVGRLSFNTAGGTSYCSATSISNNVLLTAAHCLYDTSANVWYSGWVFRPAYRAGSAPFGSFAAMSCTILNAWINQPGFSINGATKYDIGVCKMGKNSAGLTMNQAVGWMGRQWNWPYVRHFHTMGYPFRNTSDQLLTNAGAYLRTCAAESFTQTTDTRGMGCNFSRGISGGPWVANYAINVVSGNADGVNSGFFIGTKNLYSARFTSNNIVVLCSAPPVGQGC